MIHIPMIVFSGESNSGGYALNSSLTSEEAGVRPALQILNNTTGLFESLDIGTNNLIGHVALPDNASHGWENELANMATVGTIKNPTYLVKTGQGASTIAQWNTGGTYANTFNSRVDNAVSLRGLTGDNKFVLFYSQGLNDAVGSWNTTTWVNATIARFEYLRSRYGMFPIVMTKFWSDFSYVNTAIDEVCAFLDNCYSIETDGLAQFENHWYYNEMKVIAGDLVEELKSHGYSLSEEVLIGGESGASILASIILQQQRGI